jgi:steroid delta-isomerase-like uncharacterized protein
MAEAREFLFSDRFITDPVEFAAEYPAGSREHIAIRQLLVFMETLGTLDKYGLISEDLLFDWLTAGPLWERLKGHALRRREQARDPRLYENFEALVQAEEHWMWAHDTQVAERNKLLVRRWFEDVFNRGNVALVDELFATDYILHDPATPVPAGREGARQFVTLYHAAFPDAHITIEEMVAEGNTVVTRWTGRGTQKGDLPAIPASGKAVVVTGFTVSHIIGDRIATDYLNWDTLGMLRQLGVAPGVAAGRGAAPAELAERNRALVLRFYQALNTGDSAALGEYLASDFVDHTPQAGSPTKHPGVEGVRKWLAARRAAFPDARFTPDEVIAEGDRVVVRETFRGTQQGQLGGIPGTGKAVVVTALHVLRIADGKIAENWDEGGDVRRALTVGMPLETGMEAPQPTI